LQAGALALALCLLAASLPCAAQPDADPAPPLELHGYGKLSLRQHADAPDDVREFDGDVSLLGVWRAHERVRLWMQLSYYKELGHARVEWSFVDWDAAADLTLRAGRVRLPMGLYNEARDVQSLRNAATVPLMYEGSTALVDEVMRGVVVEHRCAQGLVAEVYAANGMVADEGGARSAGIAGLRLQWSPPGADQALSLSALSGRQAPAEGLSQWRSKQVFTAGAKQRLGAWEASGEVGAGRADGFALRSAYVQADLDLGAAHAVFARADLARRMGEDRAASLVRSRLAGGWAWKPDPGWGLRAEVGVGRGGPPDAQRRWSDFMLSLNFYR
jgi:hypothetical protein